jgi:3-oxoacyl-[acyl-carrier protein] reductase
MGALGGKAAVVTGGSRGIGRAILLRLAEEGVSVAFSFVRDQRAADEVVAAAQAAGVQAVAVQADQGVAADQQRLLAEAVERLGGLDILVNNAAIAPVQQIAEVSDVEEIEFSQAGSGLPRGVRADEHVVHLRKVRNYCCSQAGR